MEAKKSRVYTKTGDKGFTSLVGGKRILKSDIRLEAYGTIDELNSYLGLLMHEAGDFEEKSLFIEIQKMLFTIGSILATETDELAKKYGCKIEESDIKMIEDAIDCIDAKLPKMKFFVLPGGSKIGSLSHICRTICRRAERQIITLSENAPIDEKLLIYINRLSDLLFVFSRKASIAENGQEFFWETSNK